MAAATVEELILKQVACLRRWKRTRLFKSQSKWDFQFTVMTYNILSQAAVENHRYLYRNCNPLFVMEDYRISKIIPEILRSPSDIICLQEVEWYLYENRIKGIFDTYGFSSIFKKRTGTRTDGCAILWRRRKFNLVQQNSIEFKSRGDPLLDRDNIGLIAVFQPNHPKSKNLFLHVATTHLLFNPKRGDIKLCQLRWLLAELERMSLKKVKDETRYYHPVILCGDLNIEPHSLLYEFIDKGSIDVNNVKSGDLSGQYEGKDKGRELSSDDLLLDQIGISDASRFENASQAKESVDDPQISKASQNDSILKAHQSFIVGNENTGRMPEDVEESGHCFTHDFQFVPAYKFYNDNSLITSMIGHEFNAVDHIFYNVTSKRSQREFTEGRLKLLSVYTLMNANDIVGLGGLPNAALGSDHICLMSQFALKLRHHE